MNYKDMLKALCTGKKVRRKDWDEGMYLYHDGVACLYPSGLTWFPGQGDLMTNDWEILSQETGTLEKYEVIKEEILNLDLPEGFTGGCFKSESEICVHISSTTVNNKIKYQVGCPHFTHCSGKNFKGIIQPK